MARQRTQTAPHHKYLRTRCRRINTYPRQSCHHLPLINRLPIVPPRTNSPARHTARYHLALRPQRREQYPDRLTQIRQIIRIELCEWIRRHQRARAHSVRREPKSDAKEDLDGREASPVGGKVSLKNGTGKKTGEQHVPFVGGLQSPRIRTVTADPRRSIRRALRRRRSAALDLVVHLRCQPGFASELERDEGGETYESGYELRKPRIALSRRAHPPIPIPRLCVLLSPHLSPHHAPSKPRPSQSRPHATPVLEACDARRAERAAARVPSL